MTDGKQEMWAEARAAEQRRLWWRLVGMVILMVIQVAVLAGIVLNVISGIAAAGDQRWDEATYRIVIAWFGLYALGWSGRLMNLKRGK